MSTCIRVILIMTVALLVAYIFYIKPVYVDAVPVDNSALIDSLQGVIDYERDKYLDVYEELTLRKERIYSLSDSLSMSIDRYKGVARQRNNLKTELNKINNEVITDSTIVRFFNRFFARAKLLPEDPI